MTTTQNTTTTARGRTGARAPYGRLLLVNLGVTVVGGAATEAWAGIVRGMGVDLRIGDPFGDPSSAMELPVGACATSIVMCMVLGAALSALLNWKARRPAYTYVVVASLLTFVSLGAPLVSAGASGATKLTLIVAHLIAAALIVPLVARCLARR
jgi:Family of unknown function (DUF6069)